MFGYEEFMKHTKKKLDTLRKQRKKAFGCFRYTDGRVGDLSVYESMLLAGFY